MSSVDGLVSGLDTTAIIDSLMSAERIPQNQLKVQQATAKAQADALASLRGGYDAIRSALNSIDSPNDWNSLSATSSSADVSVTADTGSLTGAVNFTVVQRATAKSVYSTQTLSSLDAVVAPGGSVFSARDFSALGFSDLSASGLAVGPQTFEVTQGSNAAVKAADTSLADNVTIDATNDSLTLSVNGTAHTLAIAHGTYATAADLAAAVGNAISDTSGLSAELKSSINPLGQLEFVTVREGSSASLQLTGGTAATAMGLSTDPAVISGVDGIVSVNGTTTTITNTDAGGTVALGAGTGAITATLSGGLRIGTANVEQTSFGNGTLTEVVNAINGAGNSGTRASIVQVSTNAYRLQLSATETGAASAIDVGLTQFTGLTGFTTLTNGQDASIQISGLTPYTVTSSTDTFTDLMPGVDVTLNGTPTGTVTVEATRDVSGLADGVSGLVASLNLTLQNMDSATAYDTTTNKGSILTGNSAVRRARQALVDAMIRPVAGASLGTIGLAGVTLNNDGTFKFDRAAFKNAYNSDPAEVQRLFTVDTTSSSESVLKRLDSEIDSASAFGTGYLRSAEDNANAEVADLQDSITGWDHRLSVRETSLRAMYTRLESSLNQLKAQSTWLASQVAGLTSSTGN